MSADDYPALKEFDRYADEINAILAFADAMNVDRGICDCNNEFCVPTSSPRTRDYIKDVYGIDMDEVERDRQRLLKSMLE